jgi:hypothetical protein
LYNNGGLVEVGFLCCDMYLAIFGLQDLLEFMSLDVAKVAIFYCTVGAQLFICILRKIV